MERGNFFIGWLRRFAMIHGFTMMMLYVITRLSNPDAVFDAGFLGNMILFSFSGTLPGMIYYSRHDLSEREWWIRTAIHYVLLNVLLLPISNALGLWQGNAGMFVFAALILAVDVLVHVALYGLDWIVARDINAALKRRQGHEV